MSKMPSKVIPISECSPAQAVLENVAVLASRAATRPQLLDTCCTSLPTVNNTLIVRETKEITIISNFL